jgi:PilZ domain
MTGESSENRRKFQRILFDADTKIEGAPGSATAKLIDISLNGALIQNQGDWPCAIGDDASISIQLDKDEEFIIRMQTKVTHIEQDQIGMHCEHIDMDSITHLRRLLELNLGDSSLLERELAALG